MKKTFTLIICISISIFSYSQKQVTLEDIWLNYKFYPSSVSGFKSMNDGEHYTTTEKNDDEINVNKKRSNATILIRSLLIKLLPIMKPGELNGKKVTVKYALPMRIEVEA